jgi:hypothetical protein
VPTEAGLPKTVISPAFVTDPPDMRPPETTVKPAPELAMVPSEIPFSWMPTRKLLAASKRSVTLARIV